MAKVGDSAEATVFNSSESELTVTNGMKMVACHARMLLIQGGLCFHIAVGIGNTSAFERPG